MSSVGRAKTLEKSSKLKRVKSLSLRKNLRLKRNLMLKKNSQRLRLIRSMSQYKALPTMALMSKKELLII